MKSIAKCSPCEMKEKVTTIHAEMMMMISLFSAANLSFFPSKAPAF